LANSFLGTQLAVEDSLFFCFHFSRHALHSYMRRMRIPLTPLFLRRLVMRPWLVAGFILTCGLGLALAQDSKERSTGGKESVTKSDDGAKEETTKRLRGVLPPHYRKLALSQDQVQKIYKIQANYDDKLAELEEKIKQLKGEEKKEIEGVLTTAQKARLKEILMEATKDK
jgi:hypothetical protein